MRKLAIVGIGILVLLLFALTPMDMAPKWTVAVRYPEGPVSGIPVSETRQDYSCETQEQVVRAFTDAHGEVTFPVVRGRRNALKCIPVFLRNLGEGVHASLGRHVRVDVEGVTCVEDQGHCVDWTGSPKEMHSQASLVRPIL